MALGTNMDFEKIVEFSGGPLKGIGLDPTDPWLKGYGQIALIAGSGEDWQLEGPEGKPNPYGINVVEMPHDDAWSAHFIPVSNQDTETALISVLTRLTRDRLITVQQREQAYEAFGIVPPQPASGTTYVLSRPRQWVEAVRSRLGL